MLRSGDKRGMLGLPISQFQARPRRVITPDAFNPIDLRPGAVYTYRDLFAEPFADAALNTVRWSRTQSSAGNVEIEDANDRLKVVGNGNWGDNGMISTVSFARAAGLTFQCDFLEAATTLGLMVGFHDGVGVSYTDFAHGIDIYNANTQVHIFENGNSRGDVGSGTIATNTWYRLRITIGAAGAAAYYIQGGAYGGGFGTTTFTTITPGTSSSATDPLYIAISTQDSVTKYVRNVIVYR